MLLESNPANWMVLDSVPSTNTFALNSDLPPGSVVFAHNQTVGRGRQGRSWIAQSGDSVIFSGLLEFPVGFVVEQLRLLPLLTGYAVLLAAEDELGCAAEFSELRERSTLSIKWPNDVYLTRDGTTGKLGGVLVESTFQSGRFRVVLGIGVNYRGSVPAVSGALVPPAVLFPGRSPANPIDSFGVRLIQKLNLLLPELRAGAMWLKALRQRNYLRDRVVARGGRNYRVIDFADTGELLLEAIETGTRISIDDTIEDLVPNI